MQWCPEFAREYLLTNGMDYDYEDLLSIAKGQLALEDEFTALVTSQWSARDGNISINPVSLETSSHAPMLFIDTDMYVMKVWCEYVFGKCHQFIIDQIVSRRYDLYLLCNTDLPWVKDELREYPDLAVRNQLFRVYKDLLINQHIPWVEISGNDEDRLLLAIDAVEEFIF